MNPLIPSGSATDALFLLAIQETEPEEKFTVQLSDPKGGAEIGQPSSATVIINANDYQIYFVRKL